MAIGLGLILNEVRCDGDTGYCDADLSDGDNAELARISALSNASQRNSFSTKSRALILRSCLPCWEALLAKACFLVGPSIDPPSLR